jgi:hypothetical protein
MTWFRREPEVEWVQGFGDEPKIQNEALAMVADALRETDRPTA